MSAAHADRLVLAHPVLHYPAVVLEEGALDWCRYAKRAKTSRLEWNEFTKEYFLKRESLAMVLLLVDGSIPPQAIDLECAMWLAESEVL